MQERDVQVLRRHRQLEQGINECKVLLAVRHRRNVHRMREQAEDRMEEVRKDSRSSSNSKDKSCKVMAI